MILLDTSAFLEWLDGSKKGALVDNLCSNQPVAISAVTVNEALVGKGRKRKKALEVINSINVLDFTKNVAINTVHLENVLREKGEPMSKLDVFIAGTAVSHNIPLITLDKAFVRIPGLDLKLVKT